MGKSIPNRTLKKNSQVILIFPLKKFIGWVKIGLRKNILWNLKYVFRRFSQRSERGICKWQPNKRKIFRQIWSINPFIPLKYPFFWASFTILRLKKKKRFLQQDFMVQLFWAIRWYSGMLWSDPSHLHLRSVMLIAYDGKSLNRGLVIIFGA